MPNNWTIEIIHLTQFAYLIAQSEFSMKTVYNIRVYLDDIVVRNYCIQTKKAKMPNHQKYLASDCLPKIQFFQ